MSPPILQEPPIRVQRVVWGALGSSMAVTVGVIPRLVPPVADLEAAGPGLVAAALGLLTLGAVLGRGRTWSRRLTGMALIEGAAVAGLVAWLISGTPGYLIAGLGALLCWGSLWPREGGIGGAAPRSGLELPPPVG